MRLVVSTLAGALLFALADADGPISPLTVLAAFAALLVAAALGGVVVGRRHTAGVAASSATLRARAQRRGVPRAVDPDGAGRPRPRAPSLHLA
ncbi:DUF6412 domain-containing protein [Asanoa siamensis]|uniref:Uncharacterized protein n=1 Tax=Asanoa siamensis TaxID=926357 RepID=A0ABQ4CTG5_9ACTN|nr:DUF6412 domain-containing protein [Asanoa siamensis]GIF74562.1 hypothetical protein Asi02nite_40800 [Asanoa siamensis]